jgi:hypothetical protein
VTSARFNSALKNRLVRSAHCSSLFPRHYPLTCLGSYWGQPIFARTRWLEGSAHVKFTVGVTRDLWLPAEVEVLLPGIAVGPPALVPLERSKRPALFRRNHEIAAL